MNTGFDARVAATQIGIRMQLLSLSLSLCLAGAPLEGVHLESLNRVERRQVLSTMSEQEKDEALRRLNPAALADLYHRSLAALGVYQFRMEKVERLRGELFGPVVLVAYVREQPLAIRAVFVEGPGTGRRALYNRSLRPDQIRVRQPGLASLLGALWIRADHPLTRRETNHAVGDVRLGFVADQLAQDVERAQPQGGLTIEHEGMDSSGAFCSRVRSPPGAVGLYAELTRLCTDPLLGLPVRVEVFDRGQLREHFRFRDIAPVGPVADDFFTPEQAGL